jgi:hypothetical protein
VRHLYRTDDVARVLSIIADTSGGGMPASERPTLLSVPPRSLLLGADAGREPPVIESVSAITDRRLEAYLKSRAIPLELARLYLQEVGYRVDERRFRALGFANDA